MNFASLDTAYESLLKPKLYKNQPMRIYTPYCIHCESSKYITMSSNDGNTKNYCSRCKRWSDLNGSSKNTDYGGFYPAYEPDYKQDYTQDYKQDNLTCKNCNTSKYLISSSAGSGFKYCNKCKDWAKRNDIL